MTHTVIAAAAFIAIASSGFAMDQKALESLDANGDGSVSKEEFDSFSSFAFDQMDVDSNGALSTSEMAAHADDDAIGRADADGNGLVTKAEFIQRMDANFEAADEDGDGKLN